MNCNIIKDLLPLYSENLASEDSKRMVEEHLKECENCRRELEKINQPILLSMENDKKLFQKVEKKLKQQKWQAVVYAVLLSLLIGVSVLGYLTAPEYIPYEERLLEIDETAEGIVVVKANQEIAGYDINRNMGDNGKYEYHITVWNSLWNTCIQKNDVQAIVLNADGSEVERVYYYQADGSEDILIYGGIASASAGTVTLPRLVLGYYIKLAVFVGIVFSVLLLAVWRKRNWRSVILKLWAAPLSYLLGHLCIKGFHFTSYSAGRDFFAILLASILIYLLFLSILCFAKLQKNHGKGHDASQEVCNRPCVQNAVNTDNKRQNDNEWQ